MQPGHITVISKPFTANPTDAIAQIEADAPDAWYRFKSTTSLINSGSTGADNDGSYEVLPATLVTGPLTVDDSPSKGLRVREHSDTYPDRTAELSAVLSNQASFVNRGTYNVNTLYETGDVVNDGLTRYTWYIAEQASQGQSLLNTTYWTPYNPASSSVPLSLPTRQPWSLECWIKFDRELRYQDFYWMTVKGSKASGTRVWGLGSYYGGPMYYTFIYDLFVRFDVPVADYDYTTWRHIVVTNSGSTSASSRGRQAFYIDGVLAEEFVNGASTPNLPYYGRGYSYGSGWQHQPGASGDINLQSDTEYSISTNPITANTDIANLCFYSRELSVDRVKDHFQAAP